MNPIPLSRTTFELSDPVDNPVSALKLALWMIENYQVDIRSRGLDKDGFCQGSFYQRCQEKLANYLKAHPVDEPAKDPLVDWLEGVFQHACVHDAMRLKEALWMIKVGKDQGHSAEKIIGVAIASFVKGLILKTQPITVPVENN